MKRQIAILGSTGSIGTQALQVIKEHPDLYEVYALTANNQVDLLVRQAREFMPEAVVIANEDKYPALKEALSGLPIKVYAGKDALAQIVESKPIDIVLTAMVGYAGLLPTMNAIRAGKAIALANKETMVVAGEIINALAQEYHAPILPVDSEHSAIFQCLEVNNPVSKVILTASGGPFRTYTIDQLRTVTKAQALHHPNWHMGAKITIDSASMMNKGFEVIEAKWLFGVRPDQIEVVVHPQSVIHSMVEFEDGAVKAQLGVPDMRLPIQYAFSSQTGIPFGRAAGLCEIQYTDFREARHGTFPQLGFGIRSLASGWKYALHRKCRQRGGCSRIPGRQDFVPRHERSDREDHGEGIVRPTPPVRRLCSDRAELVINKMY